MKWICIAGIIIGSALYLAYPPKAFSQQVTIYTGPNGGYVGQAVVMSPTQPNPPIWSPNAQ